MYLLNVFFYLKKVQQLNFFCDLFLNYYVGYMLQLEGKYDEVIKLYMVFEIEYKKVDNFVKFVSQYKKECVFVKKMEVLFVCVWVDNVVELNMDCDEILFFILIDGFEMIFFFNCFNGYIVNVFGDYDYDIYILLLVDKWGILCKINGVVNFVDDDILNCFFYDGIKMLFYCKIDGQFDIYELQLKGVDWIDVMKMYFQISLGKVNEIYVVYSEDGYKIYFLCDNEN